MPRIARSAPPSSAPSPARRAVASPSRRPRMGRPLRRRLHSWRTRSRRKVVQPWPSWFPASAAPTPSRR
eukprot:scaffold318739_cov33-Tisochrysis_lutea.AAC.1